ncbi:MAG TPA: class I SAM-dependent methyltransferase [Steroidobacteraceae bacterium]
MSLKSRIPWQAKIATKIVLSRLPVRNGIWHRLNLFSHGFMDKPEYALGVFQRHYERADFARKGKDFVCLEVGPGDSLASAVIARAHGASRTILLDAGSFATQDLRLYRMTAKLLSERGLHAPQIDGAASIAEILEICSASYVIDGLASLRQVPSASVDFIWSHAVLEHIRVDEFLPTMNELRRVLRPDGVCSHRVDLQDHLAGELNNMRFSSRLWERNWMARSGFYTNRIRMRQMVSLFEAAGFAVDVPWTARWSHLPTPRSAMAAEFRDLTDAELLIYAFDAVLRPIGTT